MAFGYRKSRVIEEQGIVLEAELDLKADDPEAIAARMETLKEKRVSKQPLEYASAEALSNVRKVISREN